MSRDDAMGSIELAVGRCNAEDLTKLLHLVEKRPTMRKQRTIEAVARHLEGEKLRLLWERLDSLAKAAVAEVAHSPESAFRAERFIAKHGRIPDGLGHDDAYGARKRPSLLSFFFYGYGGVMPLELKQRLREFVPKPAAATLATVEELPRSFSRKGRRWSRALHQIEETTEAIPIVVRSTERSALREVQAVLRLVDAGMIAVGDSTHRPTAASMTQLAGILEEGDFYPAATSKLASRRDEEDETPGPIRAFAWPMLFQAGGLATPTGPRLRLTRAGQQALSDPPATVIQSLWKKWIASTVLDELSRVEAIKGQTGQGKRRLTYVEDRRIPIADGLGECPVGRWIPVDEFFRYLRAAEHDFEVTTDAWKLYFTEPRYGSLGYEGCHDWKILQARYVLCFLFEYAATLGLIDVAYVPPLGARRDYSDQWGTDGFAYLSRYDGLQFFRLTPLGNHCLGGQETYVPAQAPPRRAIRVLPNLDVVACQDLFAADRLALDAFAEKTSDSVWRLDAAKLLTWIERGRSVDEAREFLIARVGEPLPPTASRFFDDLAERAGRLADRGLARLVECDDAALAALIAHDRRAKRLCLLAGERHLVVKSSDEPAFRRAVREIGYPLPIEDPKPRKVSIGREERLDAPLASIDTRKGERTP